MRPRSTLFIIALLTAVAHGAVNIRSASAAVTVETPGTNRIIEITDKGVFPQKLEIDSKDLDVFLLNGSRDSLVTFEIDYGKHVSHCANDNLKDSPDGKARSVKPLGPRDFELTCFHDPGTYPVKFFGVNGKNEPVTATVVLH